ncbi:flagellar basal body-associated FliL family protein [Salipiger pallidus]|uniref:flagellar basal body-associated FliL family protein n=1 Tax=Salipiger pallidus TaxID=1775170 RepID=UPI00166CBF08|nr:flagellar basal body-associated FliL family protein [Salipiger pallidus]
MKKALIAFAGLPLVFAAAGYAGGQVLPVKETPAVAATETAEPTAPNAAEGVLDKLADEEGDTHAAADKTDAEATPSDLAAMEAAANDSHVVRLGRMSVPVYGAHSVTYMVSEIGVQMRDLAAVADYNEMDNTSRLRDAVLAAMHRAAEGMSLTGAVIDTPELSEKLKADLKNGFGDAVSDVLVLSMVQAEVPRS